MTIKRRKPKEFFYLLYAIADVDLSITADELNFYYKLKANNCPIRAIDFGDNEILRQIVKIADMRLLRLN